MKQEFVPSQPDVLSLARSERAPRRIYRFSVIPGGVYSEEELARARRIDPTVRAHYADFGSNIAIRVLSAEMNFYVSYRIASRTYWTAHKHPISKGELVFSDGSHLARARCGNRLSLVAQEPRLIDDQPEEKLLDEVETPTASVLDAAKPPLSLEDLSPFPPLLKDQLNPNSLDSTVPENTGMEGSGFPVSFVQSTGVPPVNPSPYRPPPVSNAPEPTTLGLFIACFGTVLLGWLIRKT